MHTRRRFTPALDPLEGRVSLSHAHPGVATRPAHQAAATVQAQQAVTAAPATTPVYYAWYPDTTMSPGQGWSAVPTAPAMSSDISLWGYGTVARVESEVVQGFGLYAYLYKVTTLAPSPLWGLSWSSARPLGSFAFYGPQVADLSRSGALTWPGLSFTAAPGGSGPGQFTAVAPPVGCSVQFAVISTNPPTPSFAEHPVTPVGWGAAQNPLAGLPIAYAP